MRIGIYLAYGPIPGLSLKQEGLGRYLSELMRALNKNGDKIVIACPLWMLNAVGELIEEFRIPQDEIEFLISKSQPILYKLYLRRLLKKPRKKKIKKVSFHLLQRIVLLSVTMKNYFLFFGLGIIAILLVLICILPLLVFMALFIIYVMFHSIWKKVMKDDSTEQLPLKNRIVRVVKSNKKLYRISLYLKENFNKSELQKMMREDAAHTLIQLIDHIKEPVDIWYAPMAFWPEFNEIKSKKVVCLPDLLTEEFATSFSLYDVAKSTKAVRRTALEGTFYITYCNYIKYSVLVNKYKKHPDNICVIPHAVNDTFSYIDVRKCFSNCNLSEETMITAYARERLSELVENCPEMSEYLGSGDGLISFMDIKYIFYSAQARPSKNIINLVKAYEDILRSRNIPVKLFLTCNLNHFQPLKQYIYEHALQHDVLCFKAVSNKQLASLYRCAELVVTPTIYEGGFPFTFGEGMSVGTPSIMSDIPQVREILQGDSWDKILFDPYNYKDMADKIEYALKHRDDIYMEQKKLFAKMQERSWNNVAEEYVQAFSNFLAL